MESKGFLFNQDDKRCEDKTKQIRWVIRKEWMEGWNGKEGKWGKE